GTFNDEQGHELLDVPEAPRPDPGTPAPPRFLPAYDNLLLSHADRTRIMDNERRWGVFTSNRRILGTVLIDGFVHGTWRITREHSAATLIVTLFKRLSRKDTAALASEGARLLNFAAA